MRPQSLLSDPSIFPPRLIACSAFPQRRSELSERANSEIYKHDSTDNADNEHQAPSLSIADIQANDPAYCQQETKTTPQQGREDVAPG